MSANDPDFGAMRYNNIDAWDCRIDDTFPHANTRTWAVHVWAAASGPTEVQRSKFRQLKSRYVELWPVIARSIVAVHATIKTVDQLSASTSGYVAVHVGEHSEESIELVYSLNLPHEGHRGYFVLLDEWKVKEAIVAE